MTKLESSLDETIQAAVQSRIEATVAKELLTDDFVAKFINTAINAEVNVDEQGRRDDRYGRRKTTWLQMVLADAIREATKDAAIKAIAEHKPLIQEAVEAEIGRRTKAIARATVGAMTQENHWRYGVNVGVEFTEKSDS